MGSSEEVRQIIDAVLLVLHTTAKVTEMPFINISVLTFQWLRLTCA